MHLSGPLPLTFEGPEQGFGSKNSQNVNQGKHWPGFLQGGTSEWLVDA